MEVLLESGCARARTLSTEIDDSIIKSPRNVTSSLSEGWKL